MNKLLMLPLTIMLFLTLYSIFYTGTTYVGQMDEFDEIHGGTFEDSEEGEESGNYTLPESETAFNIWSAETALTVLLVSIAIGIAAGIQVLGSGLAETSVNLIFITVLYLALWACLTIIVYDFVLVSIAFLLWIGLTIMFVIGVAQEAQSGQ